MQKKGNKFDAKKSSGKSVKTFVANRGKEYGGAKERTRIIDWLDIRAQREEKRQRNIKNA